jgi:hypothetical protein
MGDSTVHDADDLEAMSPNERAELLREGIITDPKDMPKDLVARARDRLAARVGARDAASAAR